VHPLTGPLCLRPDLKHLTQQRPGDLSAGGDDVSTCGPSPGPGPGRGVLGGGVAGSGELPGKARWGPSLSLWLAGAVGSALSAVAPSQLWEVLKPQAAPPLLPGAPAGARPNVKPTPGQGPLSGVRGLGLCSWPASTRGLDLTMAPKMVA